MIGGTTLRRIALACGLLAVLALPALEALDKAYPPPLETPVSTVVLDRRGALLRPFTLEDGRWRLPVTLDQVDPEFVDMLIAYEDQRFHGHFGIDPLALLRATGQFVANGRIVSGGSTLTMQLARLIEPRGERTIVAKLRQMARALQIERRLTKRQILELYLTRAPYGGNIEGIRAASLAWFGKPPARLTTAEAALLVALPQLPEARRPDRHPERARAARNRVLARIAATGTVNSRDAQQASTSPVPHGRRALPALAAHEADRIRRREPTRPVHETTIDGRLQARLEALLRQRVSALDAPVSAALIAADHGTGEIVARIGSPDMFDAQRRGAVDMTRAVRSPGSALKPFIYALAIDAGLIHPETLIEDRPASFQGYRPDNFDMTFQGTVTVRQALQLSLNVPAIRLLDAVGPARLMAAFRLGGVVPRLPADAPPNLAIGLGGVGVTLADLVALYTALPRGGDAAALGERPTPAGSLFSDAAGWYVSDVLAGAPPPPDFARSGTLAYKTGTSYGYRDAWAVGFDGRHVIGVWVGRADASAVPGQTGRLTAAPILFEAFTRLADTRTALRAAPEGILHTETANLPALLQRFAAPSVRMATPAGGAASAPTIVHPPRDARIALARDAENTRRPLVLKIEGGAAPYRWFANGAPFASDARRRQVAWTPDTAGYTAFTVIDANGNADRVRVYVD